MKKIILLTLTTLLLLNCSNGANEPCKDENCITDEQLNFFKMHLEDDTLTKKVLFEMSSMDLSSKSITSLDTGIFNNLINLTSVDLTSNTICVDKTDVGLAEGVNLTFDRWNCVTEAQVDFFSRHITDLDTKQKLYEAPTLDLQSKSISTLPTGIFNNLNSLTELYLYNNNLASIPREIGNLTNLTTLYLYSNNLTNIPAEIGNLTSLTELYLWGNKLTSIPDGIFTKLTNLTILSLYNNDLASLPAGIGNLNKLKNLWLDNNNLTSIPDGIFTNLTKLTILWLKNSTSSDEMNSFDCERGDYTRWGLPDPITTISDFRCS